MQKHAKYESRFVEPRVRVLPKWRWLSGYRHNIPPWTLFPDFEQSNNVGACYFSPSAPSTPWLTFQIWPHHPEQTTPSEESRVRRLWAVHTGNVSLKHSMPFNKADGVCMYKNITLLIRIWPLMIMSTHKTKTNLSMQTYFACKCVKTCQFVTTINQLT